MSFIKRLFSFKEKEQSSLMDRATEQVTNETEIQSIFFSSDSSALSPSIDDEDFQQELLHQQSIEHHQTMMEQHQHHLQEFERQQQFQDDYHQQQDMHDPYYNPGQDSVVDEHHHGIDHGFDDGHNHHDF